MTSVVPRSDVLLFARGVIALLQAWPVLRLAVQESWGGPQSAQKRTWIASTIVDAFEINPLDEEQIEDLLLDSMIEEFETEVDDGSSLVIARDIVKLWSEATNGNAGSILKLEAESDRLASQSLPHTRRMGNGDDEWVDDNYNREDEDDMDGDTAPPNIAPKSPSRQPEPVIDEDGFQLIQKGHKQH